MPYRSGLFAGQGEGEGEGEEGDADSDFIKAIGMSCHDKELK